MPRIPLWLYSALGVVALAGAVALPGEAPASPAPAPSPAASPANVRAVTVLPEGPVKIDRRQDDRSYTTTIFLRNDSANDREAALTVALVDRQGASVPATLSTDPALIQVPAHSSAPVSVRVGPGPSPADWVGRLPMRGYLTVVTSAAGSPAGTARASGHREVKVLPALPSTAQPWIVLGALALALVCVLAGAAAGRIDKVWARPMAAPTWSESWGSNITLGAALVTALLGPTAFPAETRLLPKGSYTLLSLLFPAIVGLAPGAFGALRTSEVKMQGNVKTLVHRGFPAGFVLAAALTVWGALGQLILIQFAIRELVATHDLAAPLGGAFQVLAGALALLVAVYGYRSVRQLLTELEKTPATEEQALQAKLEAVRQARAAGQPPPPEAKPFEWSLL